MRHKQLSTGTVDFVSSVAEKESSNEKEDLRCVSFFNFESLEMDTVSRRLLKELADFKRETTSHPEILSLYPADDDDLLTWKAQLAGLADTPYEGGIFDLLIKIPSNYPMQPPNITFITTLCHPNVHLKTGEICLDILKTAWSPAWTLKSTILAISLLLYNPEPSSPLNCDAANLLRCDDIMGYNSLVRLYTQLYGTV